MILETIVTTVDEDGGPNVSPMGPEVPGPDFEQFVLRPFATSRTYQNLERTGVGVLHIVDDAELLARAAIGALDEMPPMDFDERLPGWILRDACRWMAFQAVAWDRTQERKMITCQVTSSARQRDFLGWNRARHAVVEAAILATRVHLLDRADILQQYQRLQVLVDKTGGPAEHRAMHLLSDYVQTQPHPPEPSGPPTFLT